MAYKVAIAGATGNVGREMLDILAERRFPVSEVVRRRVKLQKSGREWKGLSPFNQEKTPSFFVNDQKMAWFDFSSGRNGNVFDFVMETEGLSFPEAVERLASEAGLALPTVTPEMQERERKRTSLQDVLEMAAAFFEQQLQTQIGARARGYLADRGLGPAIQKQFRIGYSPNEKFALRDYLASKGATAEQMIETGLLVHGEEIAVPNKKGQALLGYLALGTQQRRSRADVIGLLWGDRGEEQEGNVGAGPHRSELEVEKRRGMRAVHRDETTKEEHGESRHHVEREGHRRGRH